jgi:hypothetical protein
VPATAKARKLKRPKEQTRRAQQKTRIALEKIVKGVIRNHQNGYLLFEELRGAIARELQKKRCSLHTKVAVCKHSDDPRTISARFKASQHNVTVSMSVSRTHSVPVPPVNKRICPTT